MYMCLHTCTCIVSSHIVHHFHIQATDQWFELQDLDVKELLPQMITLAEAYVQVSRLSILKNREIFVL